MNKICYIGLDVHKKNIVMGESIDVGKGNMTGEFLNTDSGVNKLLKKLKHISTEHDVKICYEAGPCGFTLKRILEKHGFTCDVAAPSLIPQKAGDKIKTDKRDAIKLARLYRAGELTFISVPDEEKESVRDLVRCRDDIMTDLKRAKQRLNHFFLRHGYSYPGSNWTEGHYKWISQIDIKNSILKSTLSHYFNEIEFLHMQLKDLDKEIEQIASTELYREKVKALCAFRGIATLTAMIIISEIIDFSRFSNPKELMAYLGIVPSEYSSGGSVKKGSITKCGNKRVRRALIEAAHHYRHKPVITVKMKKGVQDTKEELRIAPVKALHRLHKKYYHLIFKGKPIQVTVTAVARELSGFIWYNMVLIEKGSNKHSSINI